MKSSTSIYHLFTHHSMSLCLYHIIGLIARYLYRPSAMRSKRAVAPPRNMLHIDYSGQALVLLILLDH